MIPKIKKLFLDKNNKIIPGRINKSFLDKQNLLNFINSSFDNSYTLSEKIYCLINDLKNRPKCKICGKELKFNHGYSTFCSRACSNKDPNILEKIKKGVSISLKRAYRLNGNLIKEKRKQTLYSNFNEYVTTPFQLSKVKDKIKKVLLKKYGVENIFYLEKYRSNGKKISQDRSIISNKLKGYDVVYLDKNKILVKNLCDKHGDVEIDCITFYNRAYRNRKGKRCIICNPISSFSSLELEFEEILINLNIKNYIKNTKKPLGGLELDFYFPDKNLAIELNGIYWHSELHKDKNYHKNKTELCENKGIRLIHLWEDDIYEKRNIIISFIKNIFEKTERKIYARNCQIKNIDSKTYRSFLNNNHIQGSINSSVKYGLFYKDEIVSIMGFGKLRSSLGSKNKNNEYELHRFCSLLNTNVIGAASKILKLFENEYKPSLVISYAKRDYSVGNLYKKLGFELVKITDPGYYWIIDDKRKHRYNYRKDKISNETNKNLSTIEIMHSMGCVRCFDSGNLKFCKKFC